MTRTGPYSDAYGRRGGASVADRSYQRDQHLESITPEDAVEWYLNHRRDDARTATRQKHRYSLDAFLNWAATNELDDLTELTGRDLMRFKTWRKRDGDPANISLNGNLAVLKCFLEFCENIDAVQPDLAARVPMPNVPDQDQVSDVTPSDEAVDGIRTYCQKFEYASRHQAIFELIAEIGLRMGAVRSIDLEDFHPEDHVCELHHRPEGPDEEGTPLKNGSDGERIVKHCSFARFGDDNLVIWVGIEETDRCAIRHLGHHAKYRDSHSIRIVIWTLWCSFIAIKKRLGLRK